MIPHPHYWIVIRLRLIYANGLSAQKIEAFFRK